VWFEAPLADEWVAAFRLSFQDNFQHVVIGEVRVFPSAGPRIEQSGQWIAQILGSDAPVPRGGLTARTLRRLKVREFVTRIDELFRKSRTPLRFSPVPSNAPTRRGRKPRSDEFFATVAVVYSRAWLEGLSRPTREVSRLMSLSTSQARTAVSTARRRRFLPPAPNRGVGGGRASVDAHRLGDDQADRLQRLATESKTGGVKAQGQREGSLGARSRRQPR